MAHFDLGNLLMKLVISERYKIATVVFHHSECFWKPLAPRATSTLFFRNHWYGCLLKDTICLSWLCSAMKYVLGRFQIKFLLPGAEGAGIGLVGAG